jgi:hypothetical protein
MHMTSGFLEGALNITTQVVVKGSAGKLVSLVVSTGGTATLWDANVTSQTPGSANQITQLGAGTYLIIFPFVSGLVVQSTGAACSVAFE